jgi:uncharacterized protein (TIGR03086 family)
MTNGRTMVDLEPPARQLKTLLSGITDDQLAARTPCEDFTVGDLLDHLMGLTIAFRNAATKSTGAVAEQEGVSAAASGPGAASAANLDPEWRRRLPLQLDGLVAAWKDPAAWTGTTEAGGVTMPAEIMGVIAMNELVIHGWDLARSIGQPFTCDPQSTEAIFALLSQAADDQGPEGLFGPTVEVPRDAPLLHRAIGLSGRDPSWRP